MQIVKLARIYCEKINEGFIQEFVFGKYKLFNGQVTLSSGNPTCSSLEKCDYKKAGDCNFITSKTNEILEQQQELENNKE